jgi:hypothetical protein
MKNDSETNISVYAYNITINILTKKKQNVIVTSYHDIRLKYISWR